MSNNVGYIITNQEKIGNGVGNMYGSLYFTRGVQTLIDDNKIQYEEIWELVHRHASMDYGDIEEDSVELNDSNINHNYGTVLSSYTLHNIKIWVCTTLTEEVQDIYTTVMLPSEW